MLGFLALSMQELVDGAVDGRAARALRTRHAVVDAMLDLVDEGNVRPSAALIAQRAGVSLRSVYQHFDDLETLFEVAAERHRQRYAHLEPLPDLPQQLDQRIQAFVAHQVRWLEAVGPMARAAALQAPFSPGVAHRLGAAWARHRERLAEAFAPELGHAQERERLLNAAEVATSWPSWESLRRTVGLSTGQAAGVVELALRRLFAGDSLSP